MAHEELTKLPGGMLRYSYVLDDNETKAVEVFALADVATPYKQRFLDEIHEQDWIVDYGCNLQDRPYKADFFICTTDAAW
ncbi:hypothetical protein [Uliginosibacterium gangwonense]|uniref:hypothetical protein n=1 Tax=Uliginosibacterium gangwonense TaxID=392736 RepID=UPI00036183F6|nr:hypothetical protein [Uliginosibacterium gangwonense]